MSLSFPKNRRRIVIFIIAAIFVIALLTVSNKKSLVVNDGSSKNMTSDLKGALANQVMGTPEISGWIAWWEEDDGYNVVDHHSKNLSSISPGWFKLDKNGNLAELGKMDKQLASQKIRDAHLKLFPMLTSELTDQQISTFTKDNAALASFVENLMNKLKEYHADGLDLDFENIGSQYSSDFSYFIKTLSENLKKNNLKFSITVQAQTGQNDWEGLKGQDLNVISQYADEVRIMIYDRHGEFSNPGPITPIDWYANVINYNLKFIPRNKLVIGLPTYGYIWRDNASFQSLQYKEFMAFVKNDTYDVQRDPASSELIYTGNQATGWLSDSTAVINKIEYARKMGLDRFIIWNLGGTDEELFNKKWENIKVDPALTNP